MLMSSLLPADVICASPLLPSCGLSREEVQQGLERWLELGGRVASNLGMPPGQELALTQQ
jgi:hypothetical protein